LEHNPAAGIDLSESRKVFSQYLTNFGTLSPIEEKTAGNLQVPDSTINAKVVGGVYAIMNDQVQLFTLGSPSRGIPYKEWTIPLPVTAPEGYGFYPGADIIAFVKQQSPMYVYSSSKLLPRAHSDVTGMRRFTFI